MVKRKSGRKISDREIPRCLLDSHNSPRVSTRWNFDPPHKTPIKSYQVTPEQLAELEANPWKKISEVQQAITDSQPPLSDVSTSAIEIGSIESQSLNTPLVSEQDSIHRDLAELRFCADLARYLEGRTEVPCEAGRIDVLTQRQVIEVKLARNWKHGIGQVLVYSSYFLGYQPVLWLIGKDAKTFEPLARRHCDRLGIYLVLTDTR